MENLNDRERHLLARSLFSFNVFLSEEFQKAQEKRDEKKSKKNIIKGSPINLTVVR